ncbi:MAG TPA: hypothetical protein PKN28_04630 [Clostridiales bacterium]|mgnify:CR=1 FL=1|nr:hypothetical protein [Clostridiales bacterium]
MNSSTQNNMQASRKKSGLTVYEITVFAMFASLMLASKKLMESIPNIHLVGMFIILLTNKYGKKALIPIYIYIFLDGLISGFAMWWVPYLYIWAVLWGAVLLLPKQMTRKKTMIVYPLINGLFGLSFGVLYAPAQAIMFNFSFKQTVAWVIAGLPFDAVHAAGNFALAFLVLPLSDALEKIEKLTVGRKA